MLVWDMVFEAVVAAALVNRILLRSGAVVGTRFCASAAHAGVGHGF
jgi:hypothetical protein